MLLTKKRHSDMLIRKVGAGQSWCWVYVENAPVESQKERILTNMAIPCPGAESQTVPVTAASPAEWWIAAANVHSKLVDWAREQTCEKKKNKACPQGCSRGFIVIDQADPGLGEGKPIHGRVIATVYCHCWEVKA